MNTRRIARVIVLTVAAILLIPPSFVWARQMSLLVTSADQKVAKGAQVRELWDTAQARKDSRYIPGTLYSMMPPDFTKCASSDWEKVQPQIQQTLFVVFLNDLDWRRTIAARRQLSKQLSSSQVAGLTACLQASVLASWCEDHLRLLAEEAPQSSSQFASPATRTDAYCNALNALSKETRL